MYSPDSILRLRPIHFQIQTQANSDSPPRLRIYRLTNFRAKFKIEPVLAGDFEFRGKIREPINPESQGAGLSFSGTLYLSLSKNNI